MLFSTPTQFAVLALALVAGWLLGLASHPGGRKWKDRYAAEREAHATARKEADVRVAEADRRTAEADARVLEAERIQAAPIVERDLAVGTRTVPGAQDDRGFSEPVRAAPVARHSDAIAAARPAYPANGRREWFDFGPTASSR